jgi:hypothetical protein
MRQTREKLALLAETEKCAGLQPAELDHFDRDGLNNLAVISLCLIDRAHSAAAE